MQKQADNHRHQVSLYCHLSQKIGMGHLKRCALIAETLQAQFAMDTHIYIHGEQRPLPWLTGEISWCATEQILFQAMQKDRQANWILDFQPASIDCQCLYQLCQQARAQGEKNIIAIERLASLMDVIDQLFVPSFYAESTGEKVSSGWQNYILTPVQPQIREKRLLILTGGTDALNYGQHLPGLVEKTIPRDWSIGWVQGPYANPPVLPPQSARWQLYQSPENLTQLMAGSEMILSCYGLSLFEAMRTGATTILLPVQHICGEEELTLLAQYDCCFIVKQLEELVPLLQRLQASPGEADKYRHNAVRLLQNADGAKEIGNWLQAKWGRLL